MRRGLLWLIVSLILVAPGCGGPARVKVHGRLVSNGQPYQVNEGDLVRMSFVPIAAANDTKTVGYVAEFNRKDSTFQVNGADGRGMAPGQYRIALQVLRKREDLLEGAFNAARSPFLREVKNSGDEIVLDLGNPG
jgi:hypothetical protein